MKMPAAWETLGHRPEDIRRMLPYIQTNRKTRLFLAACLRTIWGKVLKVKGGKKAVIVMEKMADYSVGDKVTNRDKQWCIDGNGLLHRMVRMASHPGNMFVPAQICDGLGGHPGELVLFSTQTRLVRDMIGHPWKPIEHRATCDLCDGKGSWEMSDPCARCDGRGWVMKIGLNSEWLTPNVQNLAWCAYNLRGKWGQMDPLTLAALADALEEAGAMPSLLEAIRSQEDHYRGFWPVDMILGKK